MKRRRENNKDKDEVELFHYSFPFTQDGTALYQNPRQIEQLHNSCRLLPKRDGVFQSGQIAAINGH